MPSSLTGEHYAAGQELLGAEGGTPPERSMLAAMVAVGLGIEAICRYLGLSDAALFDLLVRHDLSTPHHRPLRAQGKRGWSPDDTRRLVAWRLAGFHPGDIGARLGRSVSGVRARCRRVGVPSPPRRALRRCEPALLPEPPLDHFARALGVPAAAGDRGQLAARAIGGNAVFKFPRHAGPPILLPAAPDVSAPATRIAPPPTAPIAEPSAEPAAALEPTSAQTQGPSAAAAAAPAAGEPATGDLAWIRERKRWRKCRDVVEALAAAYFGGQHHQKIAERVGVSVSTLQSFLHRIELPRDRCREHFSEQANDALGRQRLAASSYRLVACVASGNLFFRHVRDSAIRMCRTIRSRQGKLGDWERYRSPAVRLA